MTNTWSSALFRHSSFVIDSSFWFRDSSFLAGMRMKITSPFVHYLGGLLASCAVRNWMSTLEYKCSFYDPTVDPVNPHYAGQQIYIFWHEYILFPLYLRGNNNL